MSEHIRTIFEESWARQVRTTRLIMAGCVLGGALIVWYAVFAQSSEAGAGLADQLVVGAIGAACLILGVGGLVFLWPASKSGLRIKTTGITVQLARRAVTFRWDELAAVQFHVRTRVRPGRTPEALRRSMTMELRLAPADGEFADRPGLQGLRLPDAEHYTHRIRVPTTGPFANSEERISQIDAGLRDAGGPKYAGLDRNK